MNEDLDQVYKRVAAAIIVRAATDYIRPEDAEHQLCAALFFRSDWFKLLMSIADIELTDDPLQVLNVHARGFYGKNPEQLNLRNWLKRNT